MTAAQLGPPPVAASRGGSAPSGSRSATDGATGALVETEDGGFVAVLEGHTAPTSDATADAGQNPDAAGPPTGELPTEDVADADASDGVTVAPAEVAEVIAAAVVVAAPLAAAATAPVPAAPAAPMPAGTAAPAPAPAPAMAPATAPAPVPPPHGLAPAALDGEAAVAPLPTTVPAAALAAATDAPVAGTTPAPGAVAAPAATLTLTLSAAAPEAPAAPVAPVVTDDAPAPAPVPRHDAAAAVPKAAEAPAPPAGLAAPVPAAPHVSPLDGLTRAGGLTTPHELARELGHRVQMAVREGGRELLISLRPPELGHLTIRVTMVDGALQAQILADRPEAARLLQQSLAHLDSSLGDLGYSLDSLDVAFTGRDPRDAHGSARGHDATAGAEPDAAGGTTPPAAVPSTPVAAGTPGGLDLLA
jgi:hypothetical protein